MSDELALARDRATPPFDVFLFHMNFAFGMFVISRPDEISKVKSLEDLMERYEAR